MKTRLCLIALCGCLCIGLTAENTTPPKAAKTPGVEMAQALSTITGVAISPLLGVSAVGAWHYFRAPSAKRAALPWYAQPWFWGTGLAIVLLVFIKDVAGAGLPPGWKRPFDVAELIENKVRALIAAGAFIPMLASVLDSGNGASLTSVGFAAVDMSSVYNILIMPFALAIFFIVF